MVNVEPGEVADALGGAPFGKAATIAGVVFEGVGGEVAFVGQMVQEAVDCHLERHYGHGAPPVGALQQTRQYPVEHIGNMAEEQGAMGALVMVGVGVAKG